MPDLISNSQAQRLRIYISESDRWRGKPLSTEILTILKDSGVIGASMYRGIAGFGAHTRLSTNAIEVLSLDLPVVIEVIDTTERIAAAIERVNPMVREGLITLEDVYVVKFTHRYLNPLPADRLVSEVMTRDVISIHQDMSVAEAWQRMLDKMIKAMPVTDDENHVVGIVTDEDLLQRAGIRQRLSIALKLKPEEVHSQLQSWENAAQKVADVMSQPAVTVSETETLGSATAKMIKGGLKRLPVIDADQVLVGILSRLDILHQVSKSPYAVPAQHHTEHGNAVVLKDIMMSDIPAVKKSDGLSVIIDNFVSTGSHRLIVVDEDGRAVGLISDSDAVSRVEPARRTGILDALRNIGKPLAGQEAAADLMSPGVLSAPADMPLLDAIKIMLEQSRKWIVVIDRQDMPIGLVDRQALLNAVAAF